MKRVLISAAVLALGIASLGQASAAPAVNKVTGGGQTLNVANAGNTIAFSAQSQGDEGADAKGQFQYVDRSAGKGQEQEVVHGTITCVVIYSRTDDGGVAILGGTSRAGEPFRIEVTDAGEGKDAMDLIMIRRGDDAQDGDDDNEDTALCDAEDEDDAVELARGNVQVHKAKA